jgi:predicted N-formylglutamate amidohydrolase
MAGRNSPERWLFTCEHGGREVPPEFAALFAKAGKMLASHRGSDPGSLEVFNALAPRFADAAFSATTTRLLVDLNRSLHHRKLFSEYTRALPAELRAAIVARWWRPWREAAAATVAEWQSAGYTVRHISVHSFAPRLHGQQRNADIGLLYDPARRAERELCREWQSLLVARGWRVRLNYPYRGVADGHTTALRRRFPLDYSGIELELNQALFPRRRDLLCADLAFSLALLRRHNHPGDAP